MTHAKRDKKTMKQTLYFLYIYDSEEMNLQRNVLTLTNVKYSRHPTGSD